MKWFPRAGHSGPPSSYRGQREYMTETRLASEVVESVDALEAVNELVMEKQWGDGLPVVPPTEDRVRRMVDASGRESGELVGYLDPEGGGATVEKIAVNAVMAGCHPDVMPVVVAAVEAIAEESFLLHGVQTTTNPVAPLLVVNGPIRERLGIHSGKGAFGPGWRANATIGRAVRLVMLNIGGALPIAVDQAVHGMPGKFTMCIGENEEESPWAPLHVDRGFDPGASTVTAVGIQGTTNNLTAFKKTENVLSMIADSMSYWGSNNVLMGGGNPVVLLTPGHAKMMSDAGWSKEQVVRFLFEHSKIHRSRLPNDEPTNLGLEPSFIWDGDYLCTTRRAEDLLIVVVGGPEPYHAVFCPSFGDTWAVTKEIR